MDKETKKLSEALMVAFTVQNEVKSYLSNLEKLKADGSVSQEHYESFKADYSKRLEAANAEVRPIKDDLGKRLISTQRDLDMYKSELSKLETKYKVGETPLSEFQRSEQKLRSKIEELEIDSQQLERLTKAESLSDVEDLLAQKPKAPSMQLSSFDNITDKAKRIKLPRKRTLIFSGIGIVIVAIILIAFLVPSSGPTTIGEEKVIFTTANLSEAIICKSIDSVTQQPIEKADVFTPDSPIVYCSVRLSNAPPNTEIKAQWIYIEGELAGTKNVVLYEDIGMEEGNFQLSFGLTPPASGFPRGDYEIQFYINGKASISAPFKVQ